MSKPTVLITSATGRIGKELVARLSQENTFNIRACYFSDAKANDLKALGADEVVKFDLNDNNTWADALDDVSAVYSASLDPMLEGHLAFSKALGKRKDQINHVVRVSCMGADTNTASYDANKHVKTDCDNINAEAWFSNPLGSARNSFVATRDIAEAAAVVLNEGSEKHANKFYDITGPEPQTMDEIAADLGKAMNKNIEYRAQSLEDFENDFGATRAEFFEYLSNGFYCRCSPDFYNLTGHKPTSYYDYLTTQGASGETGLEELWQGNLWKKGEDAMKEAANLNS